MLLQLCPARRCTPLLAPDPWSCTQVGGSKPLHVALALPKLERQASARKHSAARAPAAAHMPRPARFLRAGYPQPWGHVVYPAPGMHFDPNPAANGHGAHGGGARSPPNPAANGNHGSRTANGGGARSTSSSTNGSPADWAVGAQGAAPVNGAPHGNGHPAGNGYGPAAGSGNGYGGAASPAGNGHAGAAANGYHAASAANGVAAPHWPPHAMAAQQAGAPAHMGAPAMAPGGYPQGSPALGPMVKG